MAPFTSPELAGMVKLQWLNRAKNVEKQSSKLVSNELFILLMKKPILSGHQGANMKANPEKHYVSEMIDSGIIIGDYCFDFFVMKGCPISGTPIAATITLDSAMLLSDALNKRGEQ